MADKRKTRLMIGGVAVAIVLICAGVLIFGGGSGPPTLVITGIVTDQVTGQPIAGARVSDNGYGPKPYQGANTEADGRYRYLTWPEEHIIIAQAPGYKPQQRGVSTGVFQSVAEKVVNFDLEPEAEAR